MVSLHSLCLAIARHPCSVTIVTEAPWAFVTPLGLTAKGIPQINLDQLNPAPHFFNIPSNPCTDNPTTHDQSCDGGVLQYISRAHKVLTWGVLLKQSNWDDWQKLGKFLQLDQYELQNMIGMPTAVSYRSVVFNMVLFWFRKLTAGKRLGAHVTAQHVMAKFGFLATLTQTVQITPALAYSTPLQWQRISLFMELTSLGLRRIAASKTRIFYTARCSFSQMADTSQRLATCPTLLKAWVTRTIRRTRYPAFLAAESRHFTLPFTHVNGRRLLNSSCSHTSPGPYPDPELACNS